MVASDIRAGVVGREGACPNSRGAGGRVEVAAAAAGDRGVVMVAVVTSSSDLPLVGRSVAADSRGGVAPGGRGLLGGRVLGGRSQVLERGRLGGKPGEVGLADLLADFENPVVVHPGIPLGSGLVGPLGLDGPVDLGIHGAADPLL